MKILLTLLLATLLWAIAAYFDVPKTFGAHPWWSQQTLLAGSLLGVTGGLVTRGVTTSLKPLFIFAILSIIAMATTRYGQTQFAASYAENTLAGQIWYFGWIATPAFVAMFVTTLTHLTLSARNLNSMRKKR